MRTISSIALFLLALCVPAGALAGTFVVPFGGGTPMLAAGWTPMPDAGAVCAYEGTGTVFLNAGTLPRPPRVPVPLQRAGRRADHSP